VVTTIDAADPEETVSVSVQHPIAVPGVRQVLPARRRLAVRLLSGFRLVADETIVPLPLVVQRLVAFLALADRLLARSYVAGTLWPDKSEGRAAANLRSTLWRLRQPGVDLIHCTATTIGLRDDVHVDVRELTTFCRRAVAGTASLGDILEFDSASFTGTAEVLPDWYDDWLLLERERVRQLRLHATERVCAVLTEHERFADAIEVALAAVASEPLREASHRTLIAIHLAEGNRNEAVRQFERYRTVVRDALGLEPSPTIRRLLDGLHASEPARTWRGI
jgi:DNA-binding SARP family transcriptional activator